MSTRSPSTVSSTAAVRAPQKTGGRTAFAVLCVLARGPLSGAEIARWLDERIGNFWRESSGQLYPTLSTLEAMGHIRRGPAVRARTAGRPATMWTITAMGRRRLARWLAQPAVAEPRRIELLLKLFLADDIDVSAAHLARCRAEQAAYLAQYAAIEAELDALAAVDARAAARFRATVRYGVRVAEALTAWTVEAEALLGVTAPSTSPSRRRGRTSRRPSPAA
ncbi:MAG: PadR family transcriptional regulator [Gemmatimonadaceae bacterium]|nr:PadR family transcriptional regulator [Gemmatimonadaceae bacterium]